MGKKSGSKNTTRSDDTFDISSDSELLRKFIQKNTLAAPTPTLHLTPPKFNLRPLEDRRTYHPQGPARPAQATKRSATRLIIPKPAKASPRLSNQVGFAAPKHVLVCVRRKQRKQVLFAKKLTRAGAGSRKHRNPWSSIKC